MIMTLARLESYTVVYVIAIIEWKQAQVAWGWLRRWAAVMEVINERES